MVRKLKIEAFYLIQFIDNALLLRSIFEYRVITQKNTIVL